jgi:phage terminase large subunit GpA-like protein
MVDYQEYITSEHWRARKTAYYLKHPKVCVGCGSRNDIHLHHHTYKNFTKERDEDLVPLCETCHKAVHKYHRKFASRSLTQATHEVIALISGQPKKPKKRGPSQVPAKPRWARKPSKAGRTDPINDAFAKIRERRQ